MVALEMNFHKGASAARCCLAAAVIAVAVTAAFFPTLRDGWTNWDDDVYVTENPLLAASPIPIAKIFSAPFFHDYHPLTLLTYVLNYRLDGIDPRGYHALNLLLHLSNTLLVFLFVLLMTERSLPQAAAASLLFGLHPMHVESVAWISERKDVLYVFFFLAGLVAYLRYQESGKARWYAGALAAFVLSCLSKALAVVFPVALVLIDRYRGVPLDRKNVLRKLPFFAMALGFGLLSFKTESGVVGGAEPFSLSQRAMFASYAALFYIVKLFAPIRLSAFYPYPTVIRNGVMPAVFRLAPSAALAAAVFAAVRLREEKAVVFGFLFYLAAVAPVLRFVSVGGALTCDRYSYLSYVGLLFIVADLFGRAWKSARWRAPAGALLAVAAVLCARLSYARAQVWKDSETLWTDVIEKTGGGPQAGQAYLNRGRYYHDAGQDAKALQDYDAAVRGNPGFELAYNNRGNVYRELGRYDLALGDFAKAIALAPSDDKPYANAAAALVATGRCDAADPYFAKSIALNPELWSNYFNRGLCRALRRDDIGAATDFSAVVRLNPGFAGAYGWRARAYRRLGRAAEAAADQSLAEQLAARAR
jgi:tetratricopeptide (TPR) repeat protein